jgi:CheY-like chemotaxis protein
MDGLEAAAMITELEVGTPIVALTANLMANDLELYRLSGMSGTIGKPFTMKDLWGCLLKYIPVESYTTTGAQRQDAMDEKTQKLLKINFFKSNRTTYADISEALDAGDITLAHRLVHTLKSTAGQIGEKSLHGLATAMEARLTGGENLLEYEQMQNLEIELEFVLKGLAPLLTEANSWAGFEFVGVERVLALFNKLEPLIKDKDTDCLNHLEELRAVPGMEELAIQIEEYHFKQALETLEMLKKELVPTHE